MIEDVELTRRILKVVAGDSGFPAGVTLEKLEKEIPRDSSDPPGDHVRHRERITYHVVLAYENGLLLGEKIVATNMGMGTRNEYFVDQIDGLTTTGCNYLGYAQSKYWQRTLSLFAEEGVKATTQEMIKLLLKTGTSILHSLPS